MIYHYRVNEMKITKHVKLGVSFYINWKDKDDHYKSFGFRVDELLKAEKETHRKRVKCQFCEKTNYTRYEYVRKPNNVKVIKLCRECIEKMREKASILLGNLSMKLNEPAKLEWRNQEMLPEDIIANSSRW